MPSKKLAFINGRPQLVDANARVRSEADRQYNRVRNEQQSDYLRFYHSNEWKQLREQILIRDNSLCQRCGLQASLVDHIVPSEDYSNRWLSSKWQVNVRQAASRTA